MAVVTKRDLYTPLKVQPEIFSDFFTNLETHPIKKDFVRHTNEEAVKRSIKNLLLTKRGDRLFQNTLGSDVTAMMFELASTATDQVLESYIHTTIANYEPRAHVIEVQVTSDPDEHTVYATIVFSVINKQEPVILELILNRIR
jgi:phage baseplate assembly protein W